MANFSKLLIVTYGRSGSTLLQALLNSIPGYFIRGENSNLCWGLFRSYNSLLRALEHTKGKDGDVTVPTHPWYDVNKMDLEKYLEDARALSAAQLIGSEDNHSVVGFKEIRYAADYALPQFEEYMKFLELLFPDTAFIFNTRNHDAVAKSGWWANMKPEKVLNKLQEADRKFAAFHEENKGKSIVIDYDRLVGGEDAVRLYRFLGENFDQTTFDSVLNRKHSY
ncbi:sulfotransferase [Microbulbifer agarilyticus]|uniref:sulfotransferase n=1 Tax=Microbulbifer agarilyticus TaxID=260552 RepID=UPI001C93E139|nr:sulfotransferase [Microbulbifer agarilyticus]MBY6189167.1 sulfotransferase [Microbulbifer agarilyticus]